MSTPQQAILSSIPRCARFLTFRLVPGAELQRLMVRLAVHSDPRSVLGVGEPLIRALGREVPGLHGFEALAGPGVSVPSTQGAVWVFLAGEDPGEILHRGRTFSEAFGDDLQLQEDISSFVFDGGRDLSGYEDGTENPVGDRAMEVALVAGQGAGLDGGSFVAVQRWVHDLARLDRLSAEERDAVIGRERVSNEEMEEAPAFAHVKRAAQESFEPEAFMLRRSMPFGSIKEHGLYFVAYGASLSAFERVLRRMAGLEDGVVDGLFEFSRPVTGGSYFCPPLREGGLDLSVLGF